MYEVRHAGEPVDYKLIWLRFKKKIWMIPVAMIIGAVLVMGCHYFSKMIENGGRLYETTSMFYLDFAASETGEGYEFINFYTWGELIRSDYFIDNLEESLGGKYSRDKLIKSVSATIEADVRYLYVRCTTNSPEESLEIAAALEPIVLSFADEQKEFNDIKLTDRGDTVRDSTKLRFANAAGLGASLGLLTVIVALYVRVITDMGIYVPSTIEKRYGIPVLGAPFMSEYRTNCEKLLEGASKVAYIPVDTDEMPDFGNEVSVVTVKDILTNPAAVKTVTDCDAVVVGVSAGRGNDKLLERNLEELARLNISVKALTLCGADEKLINSYYRV